VPHARSHVNTQTLTQKLLAAAATLAHGRTGSKARSTICTLAVAPAQPSTPSQRCSHAHSQHKPASTTGSRTGRAEQSRSRSTRRLSEHAPHTHEQQHAAGDHPDRPTSTACATADRTTQVHISCSRVLQRSDHVHAGPQLATALLSLHAPQLPRRCGSRACAILHARVRSRAALAVSRPARPPPRVSHSSCCCCRRPQPDLKRRMATWPM
jgi:hypothetical protein